MNKYTKAKFYGYVLEYTYSEDSISCELNLINSIYAEYNINPQAGNSRG